MVTEYKTGLELSIQRALLPTPAYIKKASLVRDIKPRELIAAFDENWKGKFEEILNFANLSSARIPARIGKLSTSQKQIKVRKDIIKINGGVVYDVDDCEIVASSEGILMITTKEEKPYSVVIQVG